MAWASRASPGAFRAVRDPSSAAFARASQLIRGGIADAVIVGGADIASDLVLLGFAIERAFDIVKLPGARYIDRHVHTASGVLFDDVVSAVYAAIVLSVILHFR